NRRGASAARGDRSPAERAIVRGPAARLDPGPYLAAASIAQGLWRPFAWPRGHGPGCRRRHRRHPRQADLLPRPWLRRRRRVRPSRRPALAVPVGPFGPVGLVDLAGRARAGGVAPEAY